MTFLFNHQTCCWRRKSYFFSLLYEVFLNFYGKYHYHNVKDSSKEFSENHIFLWKALDMCVFMLEFSMFSISKLKNKICEDRNFENMHYNFFLLCGLLFFSPKTNAIYMIIYVPTLDNTREYIGLYFEISLKLATEIKKTPEITFAFSTFQIPKFGLSVNRFITKYTTPFMEKDRKRDSFSNLISFEMQTFCTLH